MIAPARLNAVVTGATSDIGRALCLGLAGTGMRVCLLARNASKLRQFARSDRRLTGKSLVCPIDLTSDASIAKVASRLRRDSGHVDVLVHAAGAFEMGTHDRASIDDLDLQYHTNVRGPYLLTKSLLPMLRAARGQIVFINSTAGLESRAGIGQYASTQHALRAIADSLRAEVNNDGVRVLSVYLGRTATARQERIYRLEGRRYTPDLLVQPEDVAQMVLASVRLPRTAEVTELRIRPLIKSY
jgi:NADP-dependent 3-hydroxy acid dehydrogenase YdfG